MPKNATLATRFVSFVLHGHRPARVQLRTDQEVVREDAPCMLDDGCIQRFLYVRGPVDSPVYILHRELLPDGSRIWVRYPPDVDVPVG